MKCSSSRFFLKVGTSQFSESRKIYFSRSIKVYEIIFLNEESDIQSAIQLCAKICLTSRSSNSTRELDRWGDSFRKLESCTAWGCVDIEAMYTVGFGIIVVSPEIQNCKGYAGSEECFSATAAVWQQTILINSGSSKPYRSTVFQKLKAKVTEAMQVLWSEECFSTTAAAWQQTFQQQQHSSNSTNKPYH